MSEERKPTFNPFEKPKPKNPLLQAVEDAKQRREKANAKAANPTIADLPSAGYFLSEITKTHLLDCITKGTLKIEDLPFVYKLSKCVATTFQRKTPTLSDVEVALNFRSIDRIKQIINGKEVYDPGRKDLQK